MRSTPFILLLLLGTALESRGPLGPVRNDSCLALAFGAWAPERPHWVPSGHPAIFYIRLTDDPIDLYDTSPWYRVSPDFRVRSDTASWVLAAPGYANPWVRFESIFLAWRSARDSLWLINPAALGSGVEVRGLRTALTVRGRAHATSDLVIPETAPRAALFGQFYSCTSRSAQEAVGSALSRAASADTPDTAANAQEIQAERMALDSLLAP